MKSFHDYGTRLPDVWTLLAASFLLGTGSSFAAGTLIVPPSPGNLSTIAHLTQSREYAVEVRKTGDVNYAPCFVYKTDNYASNMWGGEHKPQTAASFIHFSFDSTSVDVRVTTAFTATSVAIHPLSYGISPARSGNVITFTLSTPRKLFVEVNNKLHPLFIFADRPDVVPASTEVTQFYGPGIHKIGIHKQINSNEKVYIAGGAVVEGSFYIPTGSHDIEVRGRGIISGGQFPTAVERSNSLDSIQKYAVFTAHKTRFTATVIYNFTCEGITMVNTCGTHFAMVNYNGANHNNQFRNLKEVDWSVNTDNVFDGNDNIVDDCFFFINDDLSVTRAGSNLQITNCVFWNYLGRFFWTAGYGPTSDCVWENIDVIGGDKGPDFMLVSSSGSSGSMRNFTFRNIRVESHPVGNGATTNRFLNITSGTTKIENWLFENVTFDDKNTDEGDLVGNASGTINITFRNLKMGGSYVTNLAQSNMSKNQYVTLTFEVKNTLVAHQMLRPAAAQIPYQGIFDCRGAFLGFSAKQKAFVNTVYRLPSGVFFVSGPTNGQEQMGVPILRDKNLPTKVILLGR